MDEKKLVEEIMNKHYNETKCNPKINVCQGCVEEAIKKTREECEEEIDEVCIEYDGLVQKLDRIREDVLKLMTFKSPTGFVWIPKDGVLNVLSPKGRIICPGEVKVVNENGA